MTRFALNVVVAASIALTGGAGVATAASTGISLEPAPSSQVEPVGAEVPPVGVSPGSSSAASLACLVKSISYGAKYCIF
ncbi:hypothetical protein [Nocardia tengchongensis]